MKTLRFFLSALTIMLGVNVFLAFQTQAQNPIRLTDEIFNRFQDEKTVTDRFVESGGRWTLNVINESRIKDIVISPPNYETQVKPMAQRQLLAYKGNYGTTRLSAGRSSAYIMVFYFHHTAIKNRQTGRMGPGNTYNAIFSHFLVSYTDELGVRHNNVELLLPIMVGDSTTRSMVKDNKKPDLSKLFLSVKIEDEHLGLASLEEWTIKNLSNLSLEVSSNRHQFKFVVDPSLNEDDSPRKVKVITGTLPEEGTYLCRVNVGLPGRKSFQITGRPGGSDLVRVTFRNKEIIIKPEELFGFTSQPPAINAKNTKERDLYIFNYTENKDMLKILLLTFNPAGEIVQVAMKGEAIEPARRSLFGRLSNGQNVASLKPGEYVIIYWWGDSTDKKYLTNLSISSKRGDRYQIRTFIKPGLRDPVPEVIVGRNL